MRKKPVGSGWTRPDRICMCDHCDFEDQRWSSRDGGEATFETLGHWNLDVEKRWQLKEILKNKLGGLPNGKAAGGDEMSFEILKQLDCVTVEVMA